eukprot:c18203_g1_i1.p1 GENE.c18203_g1_i1~~c18203_g1_i1.p1  ORF type:complete len:171 (-),score=34.09 c18203_g1_i1:21-533(-)
MDHAQLYREFRRFCHSPVAGFYVLPRSTDFFVWNVSFFPPVQSPACGRMVRFSVEFPKQANEQPKIRFQTSVEHPWVKSGSVLFPEPLQRWFKQTLSVDALFKMILFMFDDVRVSSTETNEPTLFADSQQIPVSDDVVDKMWAIMTQRRVVRSEKDGQRFVDFVRSQFNE